ncbi:AaceriADL080Wp [[Ashbya] aceris (nom. inval.)]|nr:AaceriADL080Wp [[Ashbya] aceris (nom. inval.)]
MKFAERLRESSIPEWRDKYLDYKLGKKKLKAHKEKLKASHALSVRPTQQSRARDGPYTMQQEDAVYEFVMGWVIGTELAKCDEFYQWQLDQCERKYQLLKQQMEMYCLQKDENSAGSSYGATYVADEDVGMAAQFSAGRSQSPGRGGQLVGRLQDTLKRWLQELDLMPSMPDKWSKERGSARAQNYSANTETFMYTCPSKRQAKQQLGHALIEYYLTLQLLKNYRDLNVTGFRKMVKKFDKTCNTEELPKFMSYANEHSPLFQHMGQNLHLYANSFKASNSLCQPSARINSSPEKDPVTYWEEQVFQWYTEALTDSTQARKHHVQKLRSLSLQYSLNEQIVHRNNTCVVQMFTAGTLLGVALVLVVIALMIGIRANGSSYLHLILFPVWGGWYLVLLMALLFCLDCYIWFRGKVNYQFIMFGEIHSRKGNTVFNNDFSTTKISGHLYMVSLGFITVGALSLCSMLRAALSPWLWLCALLFALGFSTSSFILPYWRELRKARQWLVITAIRLVFSGAYPVHFGDFFLGDIVCSLTYSMADVASVLCVFSGKKYDTCGSSNLISMGILSCIPSYWRLMQCLRRYLDSNDRFPHLLNGAKYAMAILYNASLCAYRINKLHPSYRGWFIAAATVNSTVSAIWDLVMDWSLLQFQSTNFLLRDDLYLAGKRNWQTGQYSKRRKTIYYLSMLSDVVIRFQWVVYAIAPKVIQQSAVTSFILGILEVVRRFIWIIFRVENEHVANVHLFKITGETPLPYPVSPSCALSTASVRDKPALPSTKNSHEDLVLFGSVRHPEMLHMRHRAPSLLSNIPWAHAKDFQRPSTSSLPRTSSVLDFDEDDDDEDDDDDFDDEQDRVIDGQQRKPRPDVK